MLPFWLWKWWEWQFQNTLYILKCSVKQYWFWRENSNLASFRGCPNLMSLISLMSWFACLISLFGQNWMGGMMSGSVANGESGFWEQRELRIAPIWIFSFQSSCSAGIGNAMSALQIGILSHIAENVKNLFFIVLERNPFWAIPSKTLIYHSC